MAKKTKKASKNKKIQEPKKDDFLKDLPKDVQDKLKKIKVKVEKFKDSVIKKFEKYIVGVSLLPPEKPKEGEKPDLSKINVLVLVDDSDSKRMSKLELKEKLTTIIEKIAAETDKDIVVRTLILSELWQNCYDGKYDILRMIAMSAPVFDAGVIKTIKVTEIHKQMVLKKFEKYIVSYVIVGSFIKGTMKPTSDIDVCIVIDDTDVKKMTRTELKDKLRAIIISMAIEAGSITGVKHKLHVQTYILTDFWESLKEAHPVIFDMLRDGVPLYDRGIFMPWKQLLRMGRIKPSPEAIEMFMNSGEQMLKRVKFKIRDIGMEDIFYAILTPTQAALMLYGVPPPSPKETPDLLRDIFAKKEKLLEEKYIAILENTIKVRKDLEHGVKKEMTGKEVDKLLDDADKYLKRIQKLFTQIDKMKEEENIVSIYETVITIMRDVLNTEGVSKILDQELISTFENEMIASGKIPAKYLRLINGIMDAKKSYDSKKLTKTGIESVKKESRDLIKTLVEYMQRKRARELEKTKVKIKHGEKYAEIILLDNLAFITHDLDAEIKEMSKAVINKDGSLGTVEKSSMEEFEKELVKIKALKKAFIKQPFFESLKNIFGKDAEILINY